MNQQNRIALLNTQTCCNKLGRRDGFNDIVRMMGRPVGVVLFKAVRRDSAEKSCDNK